MNACTKLYSAVDDQQAEVSSLRLYYAPTTKVRGIKQSCCPWSKLESVRFRAMVTIEH